MAKDEINAFLGSGTVYTGKLDFEGAVRIDGKFLGEINSEGALIIGKDAMVEGHLYVGELFLSGNFTGKANITKRATLHKTGIFKGILCTPALNIEDGAIMDAETHMSSPDATIPRINSTPQQVGGIADTMHE